jgi:D-3-phosphoglycerate dehydrogenase
MDRKKVLIVGNCHEVLLDGLALDGYSVDVLTSMSGVDLNYKLADITGLVTSNKLVVTKEILDKAPLLKWIGRLGSGMEIIDVEAAAKRGIACFNSPEGNCEAVGEHALMLLLMMLRNSLQSVEEVRNGVWRRDENRGYEIRSLKVGIIGFGHTGKSFAQKLHVLGAEVHVFDTNKSMAYPDWVRAYTTETDLFKAKLDVLSYHVPGSLANQKLLTYPKLEKLDKPVYLINTSRGNIMDLEAVYLGLQNKFIRMAGLDVLPNEPIDIQDNMISKIIQTQKVIITPHIGGYTYEAHYWMSKYLLDKLRNL